MVDEPLYSSLTDKPMYSPSTDKPLWGDPDDCVCCGLAWPLTPCVSKHTCWNCDNPLPWGQKDAPDFYTVTFEDVALIDKALDQCYALGDGSYKFSSGTCAPLDKPEIEGVKWAEQLSGSYVLERDAIDGCLWVHYSVVSAHYCHKIYDNATCTGVPIADNVYDPAYTYIGLLVKLRKCAEGWALLAYWLGTEGEIWTFKTAPDPPYCIGTNDVCMEPFDLDNGVWEDDLHGSVVEINGGGSAHIVPGSGSGACPGGAPICTYDDLSGYEGLVIYVGGVCYRVGSPMPKSRCNDPISVLPIDSDDVYTNCEDCCDAH